MKNISNCKIRVLNVEHSKAIQEKAFEMGFSWSCEAKLKHTNAAALFFNADLSLGYSNDRWFDLSEFQEIFFYNGEFYHEPEPQETAKLVGPIDIRGCFYTTKISSFGLGVDSKDKETNADIKTHPIFDNGFQHGEVVYVSEDNGLLFGKGKYLAPLIERDGTSIIKFDDGGIVATVRDVDLEKQSDYEDRKNLENLSAKIANLFATSVETVNPGVKMGHNSSVFLEFTKRLKSEDLLPF